MRILRTIITPALLLLALVTAAPTQSPEPPLSDRRLSVHTLLREDAFAGVMQNDMERFARAERNIEFLLKDRPAERADLIAWKAGARLFRAVFAYEASRLTEFERLYAEAREQYREAAKASSGQDAVVALTAGSHLLVADRLPPTVRTEAWASAYEGYATLWKQQSQAVEKLPTHMRGELLSGMATSAQRTGRLQEAAEFVDRIIALLPETAYQAAAVRWKSDSNTKLTCKSCHTPGRLAARIEALKNPVPQLTFNIASDVTTPFAGRWQAVFEVGGEYTFDVNIAGNKVTGTISATGVTAPIQDGSATASEIQFSVTSPSGERIIRFVGKLDGERIQFTRTVEIKPGGSPGGAALFGAGSGCCFTAVRARLSTEPRLDRTNGRML